MSSCNSPQLFGYLISLKKSENKIAYFLKTSVNLSDYLLTEYTLANFFQQIQDFARYSVDYFIKAWSKWRKGGVIVRSWFLFNWSDMIWGAGFSFYFLK